MNNNSIEMNAEKAFYHYLSQDHKKLELYNSAVEGGKISDFAPTTLTRLRKLYYGFYSGIIYMYLEQTNTNGHT